VSTTATYEHIPVLLHEVLDGLAIKPSGIYLDGTFGRGGHSRAILEQLDDSGRLIVIDQDPEAIAAAHALAKTDARVHVCDGNISNLEMFVERLGYTEKVQGILLDMGVSSPQLDDSERGMSFMRNGPLDMRMDTRAGTPVSAWLAKVRLDELVDVLKTYGEERYAKRIAQAILETREITPITHTVQLAEIVKAAHPRWERHKHPATRVFQALRIYINDELAVFKNALESCLNVLAVGGRLTVISFHSLEDRIIKQFIQENRRPKWPSTQVRLKRIGKFIRPTVSESNNNPRARSAVLRIAEKIS